MIEIKQSGEELITQIFQFLLPVPIPLLLFYMPAFLNSGGIAIFVLILIGGVLYSAGGVIYALKKPNFSINWFGFHELFHALTAAAFICHFVAAILTVFSNR